MGLPLLVPCVTCTWCKMLQIFNLVCGCYQSTPACSHMSFVIVMAHIRWHSWPLVIDYSWCFNEDLYVHCGAKI